MRRWTQKGASDAPLAARQGTRAADAPLATETVSSRHAPGASLADGRVLGRRGTPGGALRGALVRRELGGVAASAYRHGVAGRGGEVRGHRVGGVREQPGRGRRARGMDE